MGFMRPMCPWQATRCLTAHFTKRTKQNMPRRAPSLRMLPPVRCLTILWNIAAAAPSARFCAQSAAIGRAMPACRERYAAMRISALIAEIRLQKCWRHIRAWRRFLRWSRMRAASHGCSNIAPGFPKACSLPVPPHGAKKGFCVFAARAAAALPCRMLLLLCLIPKRRQACPRSVRMLSWPVPHRIFLKFDVEGAEHAALCGAEKTIRTHRPTLLVSAYHRPQDLYDLPRLISSFGVPYRFYLLRDRSVPAWDISYLCTAEENA